MLPMETRILMYSLIFFLLMLTASTRCFKEMGYYNVGTSKTCYEALVGCVGYRKEW